MHRSNQRENTSKTVYVGLSGGVDSSVAAALLLQEGYNVIGAYMKNWTEDLPGMPCPWKDDLADARRVAAHLDIPLKVLDFEQQYRERVVDAMVAEYVAGRTPNPDVWCNEHVKFSLFYDAAREAGADLIATGHYARAANGGLLKAVDENKDQTYFLYRIKGGALTHTLFPVGAYTKPQIRELAAKFGLPTATKKDSQGICFVGQVGIREFLAGRIEHTAGPIVQPGVGQVGQHDGAVFYTIGQRQGLGIGGPDGPYFVTGKDMATNTVYVTNNPNDLALNTNTLTIKDCNWLVAAPTGGNLAFRFRHRGELVRGSLEALDGDRCAIKLARPERAVAPGQSVVVYDGQRVIGGGIVAAERVYK